jgi:Alginate export
LGLRYSGKVGAVDFDYTAAVQGGSFDGRSVEAWMFATDTGYTFKGLPYLPRIGLQIDGASGGDSSSNGGSLHTYQPMYFDAPYYSEALALSPTNLIDVAPHFRFEPAPRLTVEAYWAFYWRQNQNDAIYGGLYGGALAVNPYAGSEKIAGKFDGSQPTIAVRWRATKHLFVDLTLADFRPGPALRSMGAKNTPWVLLFTSLSF